MQYDPKQLQKDLKLITEVLGTREKVGLYTQAIFKKDGLEIVNPYITPSRIKLAGVAINTEDLDANRFLSRKIMELAIRAEEIRSGEYKI